MLVCFWLFEPLSADPFPLLIWSRIVVLRLLLYTFMLWFLRELESVELMLLEDAIF
jgi:hypothetical protein